MVKICHFSDVHFRGIARHDEYTKALNVFFKQLRENKPDIIINTGDTFHTKTQGITPEIIQKLVWMFEELASIAPIYSILGNHDGNITNIDRENLIVPIHNAIKNPNATVLKESKTHILEKYGIALSVFSVFDKENWQNVKPEKGYINIALYHGPITGCYFENNWKVPQGELSKEFFVDFDFVFLGDIHKHQFVANRLDKNNIVKPWMGYPGTLIQQNYGEAVDKGYLVWDIKSANDWDVGYIKLQNQAPFLTIPWGGSVEEVLEAVEPFPLGARYRITSSVMISQLQSRQLVTELKKHGAAEVTFKTDTISRMDSVSTSSGLKISKTSLAQDPEAITKLYKEYLSAHGDIYSLDGIQMREAEEIIRQLLHKLNKNTEDFSARNVIWSIKDLKFDNLYGYGEGNYVDFSRLENVVGIFGKNRSGKALPLDMEVPTINGWKTIETITTDDLIFDRFGKICRVKAKSPVFRNHDCYEMELSDGTKITSDSEHLWIVNDHEHLFKNREMKTRVQTTKSLFEQMKFKTGNRMIGKWSIPICQPVKYPKRFNLIHPYVLGCWLGDGNKANSGFTNNDEEVIKNIENFGETVIKRKGNENRYWFKGMSPKLRIMNLLYNKHIPDNYLYSSVEDRLFLLQGLMDTNGHCSPVGSSEFTNTNKKLSEQVLELVTSLGFKANLTIDNAKLNGKFIGKRYRIHFTSHSEDLPVFLLPRKAKKIKPLKNPLAAQSKRRYITSIRKTQTIPVQCLVVDSPDNSFLITKRFIPTHNSSLIGALMFVLYNTSDRGPIKNAHVINDSKDYCCGSVRINVGGTDYIIERRTERTLSKKNKEASRLEDKSSTSVNLWKIRMDEKGREVKVANNGIGRDDTDRLIRRLIGTPEDFLLTAFASQGGLNRFIENKATKRKEVLNRFLELDVFDRLYSFAKEKHSSLNNMSKNYSSDIWSRTILKTQKDIDSLQENIEKATTSIATFGKKRDELNLWITTHENQAAAIERATIENLEKQSRDREGEIKNAQDILKGSKKTLKEKKLRARTIIRLQKKYDLETLQLSLTFMQTMEANLTKLKSAFDLQAAEFNTQQKAVEKLEKVPCGTSFPECHFIKDGHLAKKTIRAQKKAVKQLDQEFKRTRKIFKKYAAQNIEESIKTCKGLDSEYELLDASIISLEESVTQRKREISILRKDLRSTKSKLRRAIKVFERLESEEFKRKKQMLQKVQEEIAILETKRFEHLMSLGALQQKLEKLLKEQEEGANLIKKLNLYESIQSAFSKNGIPAMILKSQLPAINREMANVLDNLVDFTVTLESDVSANIMDVYFEDGKSKRIIELGSGMEKTICSLALRVALGNLSSLPRPEIFILDESFGALDEDNLQKGMELLSLFSSYFKSIFVITHVTPIKEVADEIIEIKSDGIESTICYR